MKSFYLIFDASLNLVSRNLKELSAEDAEGMRKFFESVNPRLGRALRSRLQKILSEHSAMIANITIGLSSASSALKTSTQCQGSGGKADNDYFRQGEPQRMQHWVRRDDYSAIFF